MKAVSKGYITLGEADVRLDPWSVSVDGGEPAASPDRLDDWTYYQAIRIRTTVVLDVESVFRRLQLDQSAELGVVIAWVSQGTSLRGVSQVMPLDQSETSVELELDGALLRGDLRLDCQIVVTRPPLVVSSPLSPSLAGAVVWNSAYALRLEGLGSRMPVLAVPFSKWLSASGNRGMWWLQVGATDLFAPAESVLWMWLNDESPTIQQMLTTPDSDGGKRTQEFLKLDTYRQLVELGLRHDDFSLDDTYPVGSLGAVVAAPIGLLGLDLSELRGMQENDAQRLQVTIQTRLGGL